MRHQSLFLSIRKILYDYSSSAQANTPSIGPHNLFELVQNADDAKAKHFAFIFRDESHGDDMRHLFAYNDAEFSAQDLQNILVCGLHPFSQIRCPSCACASLMPIYVLVLQFYLLIC